MSLELTKVSTITVVDSATTNDYEGTLVLPSSLFSNDCTWMLKVSEIPSSYDTSVTSTYGRIPYWMSGFTYDSNKKYVYYSHANVKSAIQTITLSTDGTATIQGNSGLRLYSGIKYDVYKAVPSWG